MIGLAFGFLALATMSYIYHARRSDLWLQALPYLFATLSILLFGLLKGKIDWGLAAFLVALLVVMHAVILLDRRKE